MPEQPQTGTVLIITLPDGHVTAVEADFSRDRSAGFTVEEMQERRATDAAWRYVLRTCCSKALATDIVGDGNSMTLRAVAQSPTRAGRRVTAKPPDSAEKMPEPDDWAVKMGP